jgi:hypothetical protein
LFATLRKLLARRAASGPRARRGPRLELLEDRCTPATASVDLTAPEQLMLELINRARANPAAEAALYGIGLNDGLAPGTISAAPKAPLAPNADLLSAALGHSADMIAKNYFSHTGSNGSTVAQRITASGYVPSAYGENIAFLTELNNTPAESAPYLYANLFKSAGHRVNILSTDYIEVGIGIANKVLGPQDYQQVDVTEDFGGRPSPIYLTGVLYTDTDHNNFYSIGEGIAGATVTAVNRDTGKTYTTTSNSAGGYEIALPPGRYRVSVLGYSGTVSVGTSNVKVDFQTNTLLGVDAGSLARPVAAAAAAKPPDQAGVFRDGQWILDTNHNHVYDPADAVYTFGQFGDVPIVGDWNGDGHEHIGVFRNVRGVGEFILDTDGNGVLDDGDATFYFGLGGDQIVIGDWNGDGRDKVGVFRNNGSGVGVFSLDTNGDHQFDAGDDVFTFGLATDKIVIGDWNGDGRSKVGVYRDNGSGAGLFSLDTNGDHQFDANSKVFTFGLASDTVVIGDWNGDGRSKVGVVRDNGTGQAVWSLDLNGNLAFDPADLVFTYGLATDKPVVGRW